MAPFVNPYAKSSPSSSAVTTMVHDNSKKRTVRPWEQQQQATTITHQPPHQRISKTNTKNKNDYDPFDDGGIDWSEATRVMDAVVVQSSGGRGKQHQQPIQNNPNIPKRMELVGPNATQNQQQQQQQQKPNEHFNNNMSTICLVDPRKKPSPGRARVMDPRKAPSPGTAFSSMSSNSISSTAETTTNTINPIIQQKIFQNRLAATAVPNRPSASNTVRPPLPAASSYSTTIHNHHQQQHRLHRPAIAPKPAVKTAPIVASKNAVSSRPPRPAPAPEPAQDPNQQAVENQHQHQRPPLVAKPALKAAPIIASKSEESSLPPRPAPAANQAAQRPNSNQLALASLRPAAWNQPQQQPKAAAPASVSNSTTAAAATETETAAVASLTVIDPLQQTLPPQLQFHPDAVKPVSDQYRTALVQHAALTKPLNNGWTLYPHQKKAILQSIIMRRKILALDMGLGKTLIGCVWARAFCKTFSEHNLKVIVLCPVSLRMDWQRTMEDAVGMTVVDDDTKKKSQATKDADVTVASWSKVPAAPAGGQKFVVVADEAHSMQSMTAQRTQNALKLMLAPHAIGVLLLSGTPMKNGKPSNLFPLLKAIQHPLGRHQRAYEAHFCQGQSTKFGWMATGAANLPQLRALTQSHLLHLTKEQCLPELPKQTRHRNKVPVSSRAQLKHTQALQKLASVYSNRLDPSANEQAVLGAVQNLRLVDSMAKVDATVQTCLQVLKEEPSVVVFASFVDAAKAVHQKLTDAGHKGELLTGETPAKKRHQLVDNFQDGLSPVFVSTFGAGGVGLTLTAACTVVLMDRSWTPGEVHQAEDRVRRIGQKKAVTSIWMSAFELDDQIDAIIESKSLTAAAVLRDKCSDDEAAANPALAKLSIMKLLESLLPPPKPSNGNNDLNK